MKRLLFLLPLVLLFIGCKEKHYFTSVTCGETYLAHIVFEDDSFRDFTVVCDVLYAGEDTLSRYKMVFYLPDGWDDSYPLLLDRYVPIPGHTWTAYEGMPVAEAALNRGDMIVVLAAYDEWTAIPDILLAEHFLKEHDADLPGDSKNILPTVLPAASQSPEELYGEYITPETRAILDRSAQLEQEIQAARTADKARKTMALAIAVLIGLIPPFAVGRRMIRGKTWKENPEGLARALVVALAGGCVLFALNYGVFLLKIKMGDAFNTALAFLIVGALIAGSIYLLRKKGDG